jgi:hypothetical protein
MVKRILLLSAFGASLIIAVSALLTNYLQQQRLPYRESYTAPCEQDVAAFCASLQTIFSCGALLRGAGGVALVVGVTLGALAILRMTHRRWIVAGFATVAFLTGIGGLWLSQQALEAYYQLSLFPHSYPPQYFQARLAMIASMSRFYTAWSIGAMTFAAGVLSFCFVALWNAHAQPPRPLEPAPAV